MRANGKAVARDFFAKNLKFLVARFGRDPARFNTHSLRAGRATDLAIQGTPDAIIRRLVAGLAMRTLDMYVLTALFSQVVSCSNKWPLVHCCCFIIQRRFRCAPD